MIEAIQERVIFTERKPNSYNIPGFNFEKEVNNLVKSHDLFEVEMNIRSYIREYAKQGLILPNLVDLNEDGKLVNLNGIPVVPRITAAERNGAVLEASIKVEEFMAESLSGSMAVVTSPKGFSGLRGQDSELIEYPMTQTLIFIKEASGHLKSVNLVSDLTKDQSKKLQSKLGNSMVNIYGANEMEDLAQIVRNPALLGPNSGYSIAGILDEILRIRGYSDVILEKPNGELEYRSVNEYWKDLERFDALLTFDENAEKYISEFKDFVELNINNLENPFIKRRLERGLFNTILKIVGALDEFKASRMHLVQPLSNTGGLRLVQDGRLGYGTEMAFLQTKIGCNGSGNLAKNSGISVLRGIRVGGIISGGSSLDGKCKICSIRSAETGGCGFCEPCAKAA